MIAWLRAFRLRPSQALALACASALATTLVISAAFGSGPVPSAVIAALRHRVVVQVHPHQATVPAAAPAVPSSAPSPAADASAPAGGDASAAAPASSPSSSGSDSSASSPASPAPATTSTTPTASTPVPAGSKVKHVFVIALSSPGYSATWGHASVAHYLNRTLRPRGTLLSGYRTLGPAELPDYLAMVSGQAPNADTRANCPTYAEFGSKAAPNKAGQVPGTGCVYPSTVQTIGDQVTAKGKRWKAYVDGMGSATCVHPNSDAVDNDTLPGTASGYATRHNPFIYFHSLLDLGDCSNDDVELQHLSKDLRSAKRTPTYSFIAPGLCADVSALGCAPAQPSGLAGEDAFLKRWVPRILASPAYRSGGALMIVFAAGGSRPASNTAASPSPGAATTPAGASATTTPATTTPAIAAESGPDRVGALIMSPFGRRDKTISTNYNPYSVLRVSEQLLGYSWLVNATHARSFVAKALPGA